MHLTNEIEMTYYKLCMLNLSLHQSGSWLIGLTPLLLLYGFENVIVMERKKKNMIQPHQLQSKVGVKQGDPLGSLLFALSVKSMYQKAVDSDSTGAISAVAFQDDCTLVGPPDMRLINALVTLKQAAIEGGLEMNMTKTKYLWLHENHNSSSRWQ